MFACRNVKLSSASHCVVEIQIQRVTNAEVGFVYDFTQISVEKDASPGIHKGVEVNEW